MVDVFVRNGRIVRIRRMGKTAPDWGDEETLLAPLLTDIQVNGAWGVDLQSEFLDVDQIRTLKDALLRQGVIRWVPTLITDAPDAMEHKCRILAAAMKEPDLRPHLPGIHLEGPHLAAEDGPRGAHPRAHVCPPDLRLLERFCRAAENQILYITIAPELPGAAAYIRAATRRGIRAALGHHAAESHHIEAAVKAGSVLSTHLGNGLAPMLHRHRNPLWAQLSEDRLHASFIADGEHIPPAALKVFARAKQPERCVLVSDSVALAGMKPGRYALFGTEVELKPGGRVCLAGTELLAGSGMMLLQGVWNMSRYTDMNLAQAFASASNIPSRLLGLETLPWPPVVGQSATMLLCKPTDSKRRMARLSVVGVFSSGVHII